MGKDGKPPNSQSDASSPKKRINRCKKCKNCVKLNCGLCVACLDMPKFGGLGTRKLGCLTRPKCLNVVVPTMEKRKKIKNIVKLGGKKRMMKDKNENHMMVEGIDTGGDGKKSEVIDYSKSMKTKEISTPSWRSKEYEASDDVEDTSDEVFKQRQASAVKKETMQEVTPDNKYHRMEISENHMAEEALTPTKELIYESEEEIQIIKEVTNYPIFQRRALNETTFKQELEMDDFNCSASGQETNQTSTRGSPSTRSKAPSLDCSNLFHPQQQLAGQDADASVDSTVLPLQSDKIKIKVDIEMSTRQLIEIGRALSGLPGFLVAANATIVTNNN